jgi:hypothetical protein
MADWNRPAGGGRYVIALQDVKPGAKLRLTGGAVAEVVENPGDGYWVLARYLSSPQDPAKENTEEMVFVYDVDAELGDAEPGGT